MRWQEMPPADQEKEFVGGYRRGLYTMTELAGRCDISRGSGYAMVCHVEAFGAAGLRPQIRRPHTSPTQTPAHIAALLIAAKRADPAWGYGMSLHWPMPRIARSGTGRP